MLINVIISTVKAFFVVSLLTIVGISLDLIYNPLKPGDFPHEDIGLEIDKLVAKHGYPFEKHIVTTEDGYILQLHRIPHGSSSNTTNKKPLIIMHGLLESSISFLPSEPVKSLPYHLAENGYDVWLANARGNVYSRKHKTLNPDADKNKFFNFSWNEIGIYDLPAIIDYTIKVTGQKQLYYSGHSQGSVSFFVMLSERPEYNEKIRLMIGLAPVVFIKHVKAPSFYIPAMFPKISRAITEYFPEMLPKNEIFTQMASKYCQRGSILQRLCVLLFCINGGFNDPKLNTTEFPLMFSHMSEGAATKQLVHYTQIVNSDVFRKYDYGPKNLAVYGQDSPPEYKFENIKVPIALFYSTNDWLTQLKDYEKLRKKLPNVVLSHKVEDDLFTHFEFLSSDHGVDILFPHIIDVLEKY